MVTMGFVPVVRYELAGRARLRLEEAGIDSRCSPFRNAAIRASSPKNGFLPA